MHLYISYQIKTLFRRNSVLLMGHHAIPVVTLFFSHTHVICMALHYTVVIRYSPSVTYRTLCHASGHLVLYRECYGFGGECFLLSGVFYLALLPAFSRLPWGWQFNLKTSRVSCWSSKHGPSPELLFKSQQSTKDLYVVGLRARAGQSQNTNLHRELVLWNIGFEIFASYEIWTLFAIGECVV